MAFIGMQHVVVAKVATEVEGQELTYSAGMVVGKAIQGNLTWERNDNPLYADDAMAENDNGATGVTLELGTDDILDAVRVYMLGDSEIAMGQDAEPEYETNGNGAPYVGIGYMRVRRKNGVTTYQANWFHKAQFAENNENAQTKGQNIEWQTPTLNGRIFGVRNNAAGEIRFRRRANFETAAAAAAWLDAKAGI